MRRFRKHRSSSGKRRKKEWYWANQNSGGIITAAPNVNTISAAWIKTPSGVVDTSTPVDTIAPEDETVLRLISLASLTVQGDHLQSQFDRSVAGMGIIRWEDVDESAPVITDVPWPLQNGSADWLWWWMVPLTFTPGSTAGFATYFNHTGPEFLASSRAQRKLSQNAGLLLVVQYYNRDADDAFFTFSSSQRILVAKP